MKKLLTLTAFLAVTFSTFAQTVTNQSELDAAISAATAGTTITLANGTWTNIALEINKIGTAANPITLKAETTGSVFFEGNSYVKMGGEYIVFDGVTFQNPSNISTSTPVIEFKSSDFCNNCVVTNVKIDSYNGTEAQSTETFKWVLLHGQYNEISYCSFIGKWGVGSIINDNRNSSDPDYTKIHHNYFGGRTPVGSVNELNDQDAMRIGNSATSLYPSYTEVYNNFFYDFHGEVEVISNKSCNNKYYNNTFRNYNGALTLRHGNNCEVYNNFFFADNNTFTAGVRVIGENHKVYNNYIEGINSKKDDGTTSGATGGINVTNGRVDTEINGYYQVKNATIVNNTFVNCDYALRIGTTVKSDLTLAPQDIIIANNIMLNSSQEALQEVTAPTGTSVYEGNITQNGSWDLTNGVDGNITVTSGLLEAGTDCYVLSSSSDAIDAGMGTYSFLTDDVFGGTREANFDAGAEEYNTAGTLTPYTTSDVGVGGSVGFGATIADYLTTSETNIKYSVDGEDIKFNISSSVDWTINDNADWLTLDVASGSEDATITATASANTSNSVRTATITISEVSGGNDMETTISVSQSDGIFVEEDAVELTVSTVTGVGTQAGDNIADNTINNTLGDRWSADATDGSAYLTFDLGCKHTLTKMSIYFHKGDVRNSYYKIGTSNDSSDFSMSELLTSTIQTGYEDIDLKMVEAQYVRIEGYGNSDPSGWNSYEEVKFYGDTNCAAAPVAPEITSTHNNVEVNSNANCQTTLPDYTGEITLANGFSGITITQNPEAGTIIFGTTNTITLTATNSIDQTDEVSFNVAVIDNTAPEITSTHSNLTLDGDINGETSLPDYTGDVVAIDNCDDNIAITQLPASNTTISGNTNTITLTATDDNGNKTSVSFNINVSDPGTPSITSTHNNSEINADANCEGTLPDYTSNVVIDGGNSGITITQSPAPGSTISGSTNSITLTATYNSTSKSSSVSFNVAVVDNTKPEITSSLTNISIKGNENAETVLLDYRSQVSGTDNCDNNLTISQIPAPGTTISGSNNIISISITDDNNNTISTTFIINVEQASSVNSTISNAIAIYPNPTNGIVNIKGKNINSIIVYNITGKVISSKLTDNNLSTIDLSNNSTGIYFIKIYTDTRVITSKIMLE